MSNVEFYEIRVGSHLERESWSYWFDGFTIQDEVNGETVLFGPVVDQAALHGVIGKLRDLNLKLISVNRISRERLPAMNGGSKRRAQKKS